MALCDPMDFSTSRFPVHQQVMEIAQTHVHRVGDAIQISHSDFAFSSCHQSSPGSRCFFFFFSLRSQLFASGIQSIGVSASASVLPMNIKDQFLLGSPFTPRAPQECLPTPQFKSISSLVLTFLYNPTFTAIHDYWKYHNFGRPLWAKKFLYYL